MAIISIVGVGAIGGVMAGHLIASGSHAEVYLCARRKFSELRIKHPQGEICISPTVVCSPSAGQVSDWVLFASKAHQTGGASEWLQYIRNAKTPVAVLQNGVEQSHRLGAYVPRELILPVVVDCPAVREGDGIVLQKAKAKLVVENNELGKHFKTLFSETSIEVNTTEDIKTALWKKLCLNVAGGAIAALTDKPLAVLHGPGMAELAKQLILECIAVGLREGANLSESLADEIVAGMLEHSKQSLTSMLADKRAGKPLEVDARNGAVVRLGKKHGVPTPLNAMATTLLTNVNH